MVVVVIVVSVSVEAVNPVVVVGGMVVPLISMSGKIEIGK
jgi:hypothetical protein